ncbi:MAG: sulfotransferase domain-containing protein [Candidatus Brocadiaceae bacterium]|nr:sulfotransferase domain-containing protein [Candidatus Brocadiaceae bacterium]
MKVYIKRFSRSVNATYRLMTAEKRALPDFIAIGAQKCGTTSLYYYLNQHPQILPAARKEVHFFDNQFQKGVHWYRSRFPLSLNMNFQEKLRSKPVITGEASPLYFFHPLVPIRLSRLLPQVKLIVLLRNPIHRSYSHYQHNVRKKRERLSFEDAIANEDNRLEGELDRILRDESYFSFNYTHFSYLKRSIYIEQIKAYNRFFDRNQVLIIKSEDFYTNIQNTLTRVFNFLGVEPFVLRDTRPKNVGIYREGSISASTYNYLKKYFEPHNRRLYEYLGIDFQWQSEPV